MVLSAISLFLLNGKAQRRAVARPLDRLVLRSMLLETKFFSDFFETFGGHPHGFFPFLP